MLAIDHNTRMHILPCKNLHIPESENLHIPVIGIGMSNIAEIKNCLPVAKFVQNYSYFKGMKFLFVHRYSWLNAMRETLPLVHMVIISMKTVKFK